jgi:hypothetical protein
MALQYYYLTKHTAHTNCIRSSTGWFANKSCFAWLTTRQIDCPNQNDAVCQYIRREIEATPVRIAIVYNLASALEVNQ